MKSSKALTDLLDNLEEIRLLQSIIEISATKLPTVGEIKRENSVNRAAIVLLSSYFERYIYAINEEVCLLANTNGIKSQLISEDIKLLHAKYDFDLIQEMQWVNRLGSLMEYSNSTAWLFIDNSIGIIDHNKLLTYMKSPNTKNVHRYYKMWGISNIFSSCSMGNRRIEGKIRGRLEEMVTKRNSIAHGDANVTVSSKSLESSIRTIRVFCKSADKELIDIVNRLCYLSEKITSI